MGEREKIVGREHFSWEDREIDLNLIDPAGMNRGVYKQGVGPAGSNAIDCLLTAMSRAGGRSKTGSAGQDAKGSAADLFGVCSVALGDEPWNDEPWNDEPWDIYIGGMLVSRAENPKPPDELAELAINQLVEACPQVLGRGKSEAKALEEFQRGHFKSK